MKESESKNLQRKDEEGESAFLNFAAEEKFYLDCTICLNCCQRLVLKSEQFILHLRALSSLSTPCQALKKKE